MATPERGFKRTIYARVGLRRFEYTNLWLCRRRNVRIITYVPEDPDTLARLEQLRGA